jgi:4-hydroxybenzoyl-CoA reductase subunit beta
VRELQTIEQTPAGGFILGAGCRLTVLANHPALNEHQPAFIQAIKSVASWHIRNQATLGGNLCLDTRCWYTNQTEEWRNARPTCFKTDGDICHVIKSSPICVALNSSDLAPALMALGAEIQLTGPEGERSLLLSDFYRPDGVEHTTRAASEILSRVTLPANNDPIAYVKITPRKGMDFSHGTIAARLTFEVNDIASAHMVIGSMTPEPITLSKAGQFLQGKRLDEDAMKDVAELALDEMGVLTNLYTSSAHKKDLVRALVKKALRQFGKAQA